MKTHHVPSALVQYLVVAVLIYGSGSPLMNVNYATKLVAVALLGVALAVVYRGRLVSPSGHSVVVLISLLSLVAAVPLLTDDPDLGPYATLPLHLVIGFLATLVLSHREFCARFINLMSLSAAVSFLLYIAALSKPSIVGLFPVRLVSEQFDYHDAGIHVFLVSNQLGASGELLNRNNGFAWEPGAYQVFLNLAVVMLLERTQRGMRQAKDGLRLSILIVAVISTFSTGGYFALTLVIVLYVRSFLELMGARGRSIGVITAPLAAAVLIALAASGRIRSDFMSTKLLTEFGAGADKALDRVGFNQLDELLPDISSVMGSGFTSWAERDEYLWNSILHTAITLGIPFTIILFFLYVNYSLRYLRPLAIFVVLFTGFSTETLFWRMFFIYLAFTLFTRRLHVSEVPPSLASSALPAQQFSGNRSSSRDVAK